MNKAISTTESDYNVATIIPNSSVNSNDVITKNADVRTIIAESSVICNPVFTKNPEVDAIILNSSVISIPVVTKNVEVGADSKKFGVGALSPSNVIFMKDNDAAAAINSCMTVAPESVVISNPKIVDSTKISSVLDKSSSLMSTISPSHVMCSKVD